LLGVAVGVGGWNGTLPLLLGIAGGLAVLVTGLALFVSIIGRGRE
jgi:hypothetical protein